MIDIKRNICTALLFSLTIFGAACGGTNDDGTTEDTGVLDDENASFGAAGKADSTFSGCELREVLEFVNEDTTTIDVLKDEAGVHTKAAKAIHAHRLGPDGVEGTGDDDLFETLEELDNVTYVGPKALEAFANFVSDRCLNDLDKRPYIDATTFAGLPNAGGFSRDTIELEATMRITNVKGRLLNEIMNSEDDRGRRGLNRIRRAKIMEAFSFNYNLDEIPWGSDEHDAREQLPYTSYSIESGNYEIDSQDGERELDLGTDYMFDRYYDTPDYTLLQNGIQLRGRIRWDTVDVVRRLLIAAKFDSTVGDDGLKRAAKMDTRTEGGRYLGTLDDDIRSGKVSWSGSSAPVAAIRALYDVLVERQVLPTIDGKENVLLLDPRAYLRSERSRYHLDETKTDALSKVYRNGKTQIEAVVKQIDTAIASGKLTGADLEAAEMVKAQAETLLDDSAVRERARQKLMGSNFDADMLSLPNSFGSASNIDELEALHAMAESTSEVYHEFAELVDDTDRAITQTDDLPHDDYVDMFISWQKQVNGFLRPKQVAQPFLSKWEDLNADDMARTQAMEEFATFCKMMQDGDDKDFKDFEGVDETIWANLGAHLRFEAMKISQRQIEAAGTISFSLWFDVARSYYFEGSRRTYGNFMIDTLDLTEMLTPEMWHSIPEQDRRADKVLPPEKVFHTTFVNEVQIELTQVEKYIDHINELEEKLKNGEDVERELNGAKAILKHFTDSLITLSEIKGEDIIDETRDFGGPRETDWEPAEYSKGKTALKILSEGVQ